MIRLISNLETIKERSEEEVLNYKQKKEFFEKKIEEQEELIQNTKNDRDLYRELVCKEQKQRNEHKFLIENQRKMIENINVIPAKSPNRPNSQGFSRTKK